MVARITKIEGRGLPMRGEDIDTDRIMPARYLRAITFEGLEQHLFEDDRKAGGHQHNRHPFDVSHYQGASILLVNSNFGCGSSREHAPQGLQRWGIKAIVGESFAEIFFGNSAIIGMPCVTASTDDVRALMERVERNPTTHLVLDLVAGTCEHEGFRCAISLPPKVRDAFATGAWDTTGQLMDRFEEVAAVADRLPVRGRLLKVGGSAARDPPYVPPSDVFSFSSSAGRPPRGVLKADGTPLRRSASVGGHLRTDRPGAPRRRRSGRAAPVRPDSVRWQ